MNILWPIHLLAALAVLVMFPSAIAAWYSNCFNIPLSYGFGIFFSAIFINAIVSNLMEEIPNSCVQTPLGTRCEYKHTRESSSIEFLWSMGMSILIIYGVYLQFNGRCKLKR
tara:strand:+ start:1455 stop:1790 length:336 start_codon:yes stop_codon:yes gene_type:complete